MKASDDTVKVKFDDVEGIIAIHVPLLDPHVPCILSILQVPEFRDQAVQEISIAKHVCLSLSSQCRDLTAAEKFCFKPKDPEEPSTPITGKDLTDGNTT